MNAKKSKIKRNSFDKNNRAEEKSHSAVVIGNFFSEKRESQNISVEELSVASDIPVEDIIKMEAGATHLPVNQLSVLVSVLNIPIDDFFNLLYKEIDF